MINEKMEVAINKQINLEFSSAYFYLGMAAYLENLDLSGFAAWMEIQYREEIEHGMRLYHYLRDRGGRVSLDVIDKPRFEYEDVPNMFDCVLEHEQTVTAAINELYVLADEIRDNATKSHLQWFVDEQVEEEATVESIIARLKLVGTDSSALLYLDDQMGTRSKPVAE